MGLDRYAYAVEPAAVFPDARYGAVFANEEAIEPFFRWRKHPDLHGWMARRWQDRGGTGGARNFNLVKLRLSGADLDALEQAVRQQRLPKTTGPYFGASSPDDALEDLAFIVAARRRLAGGKAIFYDSWW